MRKNGHFAGPAFPLAVTASNYFQAEMHVAALPNGDFAAAWVDGINDQALPYYALFSSTGEPIGSPQLVGDGPAATAPFDVAALADNRFVVTGSLKSGAPASNFIAQLVAANGQKVGAPLILDSFDDLSGSPEHHTANVGYLLGQPAGGGLETASDPHRIYVVWRTDRRDSRYSLFGQAIRAP
jgi:hypothetical protein